MKIQNISTRLYMLKEGNIGPGQIMEVSEERGVELTTSYVGELIALSTLEVKPNPAIDLKVNADPVPKKEIRAIKEKEIKTAIE